jgi:hypothetical protein
MMKILYAQTQMQQVAAPPKFKIVASQKPPQEE